MTYTRSNSQVSFFVVGGNADGTESGRIYLYQSGPYLYDYATSNTKWCSWNRSYWTDETRLVLTASSYNVSDDVSYFGFTDLAEVVSVGCAGNKLFDGVKIL